MRQLSPHRPTSMDHASRGPVRAGGHPGDGVAGRDCGVRQLHVLLPDGASAAAVLCCVGSLVDVFVCCCRRNSWTCVYILILTRNL